MKAAVVGAGICGLSAARFLARRGHRVTLYEQFELFHDRGSSHGESRIVRRAYSDPYYTACMAEAYPMWRELEEESGKSLLTECGLLYFGEENAPNIQSTIDGLTDLGVDHQIVRETTFIRLNQGEIGVFTPEAGWVQADAALQATFVIACGHGLEWVEGTPVDPLELAEQNDAVIVCAGSWIKRYADLPVTVRRMTFGYLQTELKGPVWIEDGPDLLYGFPSTALGAKVGVHSEGDEVDPDEPSREPDPALLVKIAGFAERRLGGKADVKYGKGCLYTMAPNEDFLLGRFAPNVFFASACSGHGFKFGPWIGRLLADFAEGRDAPDRYPRFGVPSTA